MFVCRSQSGDSFSSHSVGRAGSRQTRARSLPGPQTWHSDFETTSSRRLHFSSSEPGAEIQNATNKIRQNNHQTQKNYFFTDSQFDSLIEPFLGINYLDEEQGEIYDNDISWKYEFYDKLCPENRQCHRLPNKQSGISVARARSSSNANSLLE